jgi:dTDP-4-amino-4,6-dideoxygalactose transaminase
LRLLLHPRGRRGTRNRELLREELNGAFKGETFLFASGREALLAFLRAAQWQSDDEVIVQAYTCAVVPNAVRAAGLKTIYCDIEKDTLSLDPSAIEPLITPRTRAVICQHTFGIPAPVERLREICDRRGLLLIEDCAHILPDTAGPEDIGKYGDALLLSFGRDKAISGITGGAIILRKHQTPSTDTEESNHRISDNLRTTESRAPELPQRTVRRLLLYPLLYAFARPLYGLGIGKLFLVLCRRLGLLVPIVTAEEKQGQQVPATHRLPEACAALALDQWRRLSTLNDHRRSLTKRYLEACAAHAWPVLHGIRSDLPLQKFPMFVQDANGIRKQLKRKNIHLNDGWTGCVVCPDSVDMRGMGYEQGSDPRAEEVCDAILSLPTHPGTSYDDAAYVVRETALFLS